MSRLDTGDERPRRLARSLIEFTIVCGGSLFAIFYLIPAQTTASDNFGLSPRMVPIVCAVLIAGLAAFNLIGSVIRLAGTEERAGTRGLGAVGAVIASALVAVAVIHTAGLIVGGTLLVPLVGLSVGERRPLRLAAMTGGAALLLTAVDWSGL